MSKDYIWIICGVAVYMVIMASIGLLVRSRIKDARDYIVAGGRLGWWLSIGTIFATWFGAETCMGSSGTAFHKGILGVIADPFGAGLCLIISGIFFAKIFRSLNIETIVDYFELRYGRRTACILCAVYIPVYLGWIGAQLLAFGYILNSLTGMPLMASILISTAVVLFYTYSGGMWAVSITDLIQMLFIVIGLLILFPILIKDIGGLRQAITNTPKELLHFYPRSNNLIDWLNYLQAWIIVGLGSLPAQDLFQRIMSAKDATVARWSSILSGIFYIIIGLLPVFLGIFSRIVLPQSSGESILIELSLKYLSPLFIAIMVGALLSAIMSSVDSALLAPASIVGNNIIPFLKPDANEKTKLNWCKWSVPIFGILSLFLALYFKNIYRLCQESWGILLTGVAAPMILGVYWKRANAVGAFIGAISGVSAWIIAKIFLPRNYPHNLYGFLVSFVVVVVVSLVWHPRTLRET